jgi:hypothetical protein
MKRFVLPTLAAAAGFAALAGAQPALPQSKPAATTHTVKVRVLAGMHRVVDQHPLVVMQDDKEGGIVRELPPRPSPWRVRDEGIAIDGAQFLGCRPLAQGLKYTCTDRSPRTQALYPYRITVYPGTGNDAKSIYVDSAVQND